MIPHTPWLQKLIRLPQSRQEEVIRIMKEQMESRKYELSCASYRSTFVVKSPKSMFSRSTIPGNDQIQVFIWKYARSIQKLLARVLESGATISGSKMVLVTLRLQLLGAEVMIDGAHVSHEVTAKLARWPACRNPTEVRGFLGTVGVVWRWIRDFTKIAKPLMLLTKKMTLSEFEWTEEAQESMELLKHLASTAVPVRMLDYELARKVKSLNQRENDVGLVSIHVDTSNIGVGWMIAQRLEEAEYPIVFGSITLNEREGQYSQPKLELYGVFRALKAEWHRLHNIHFRVIVDAGFIAQMMQALDLPNTAMT